MLRSRFTTLALAAAALAATTTGVGAQTLPSPLDHEAPLATTVGPRWLQTEEAPALPSYSVRSNTRVIVAARTFNDDLVDDVFDTGVVIGIEHDQRKADSGPGWEVGLFVQREDESASAGNASASLEILLIELMVGGRYTLRLGGSDFYAYAGGGVDGAFSYSDAEAQIGSFSGSESSTDFSVGAYAHAGAYYQAGGNLTIGADVRGTFATEVEDLDADYLAVGVTIGWGH